MNPIKLLIIVNSNFAKSKVASCAYSLEGRNKLHTYTHTQRERPSGQIYYLITHIGNVQKI